MTSKYQLEETIKRLGDELWAQKEITRQKQLVINALLELEPAYNVFVHERGFMQEDDYSQLTAFAKLKREDRNLATYEARLREARDGVDSTREGDSDHEQ